MCEVWTQAVFCKQFWRMLNGASEAVVKDEFLILLENINDRLAHIDPSSVTMTFGVRLASVQVVCRGICGLLDPAPGITSLQDIQFLVPSNGTQAKIMTDLPKFGRGLVSGFRKDKSNLWQPLVEEFSVYCGAEAVAADAHRSLLTRLDDFVTELQDIDAIADSDGSGRAIVEGLSELC